jgi:hypothetical protein
MGLGSFLSGANAHRSLCSIGATVSFWVPRTPTMGKERINSQISG